MSNSVEKNCKVAMPENDLKPLREIERSLIKKFRKTTWSQFVKGIKKYDLIKEGDKIAVAISGGKDSLIMAKLFQELKKHGINNFELEFICMDPGFNRENRIQLEANCEHLGIPVKIFEKNVFEVVDNHASDYPCYLCARMRRGALYEKAEALGCNKVALGHHYDDVIETVMMNVLCGGQFMTMMPKLHSANFKDMELIRPMYFMREKDIIKFSLWNGLNPMDCGCDVAAKKISSKRHEVKALIEKLGESFSNVEQSIFNSANNVHLGAILGWKIESESHEFTEYYDEQKTFKME